MAENYVVNYSINVKADAALQSLTNFQQAVNNLSKVSTKITEINERLNKLSRKAPVLDVSTAKINRKLDATIAKLKEIHRIAKKTAALNISTGAAPTKGGKTASPSSSSSPSSSPSTSSEGDDSKKKNKSTPSKRSKPSLTARRSLNTYQALGHTMIDTGGVGALDFVKGMGIAYGIAGLGSMISTTVKEATDYDNLMATARNILKTHDRNQETFNMRFSQMEKIVRNVGVETKFTAPQVADAAKFLAMAGFDVDAINKSIAPIADIALVGDTDLGETADVVTNIMTGYGISPDQVRRAADIMSMTFTKSNTTLTEIAEAYKYSASLLSAGGVSFEEATAAMGILGDAGIKGSQAGTTMRTIMANIVNPTKKQRAQWERIGVSRTDSEGRVRPLVEIFRDLNNADLYVDDFYKLFHKTAAQGAVSLAANVLKWNEIIQDNFMSDGLVAKLAEEKKNTIQGLWYQMTSAFTETGMQVFEEVNSPIRDFLKSITTWLKSDEAKKVMRDVSVFALDIISTLKSFTGVLMHVYQHFSGFVKLWLKFQLYASAVLVPLRVFKSLWDTVSWVIRGIKYIGALAFQYNALTTNIKAATWAQKAFASHPLITIGQMRGKSPEVLARFASVHKGKFGAMSAATGGAGILGAIGGAYLGSYLGEEGSLLNGLSAVGGALGGSMLLSKIAAWMPKILPAILPILTHPVTIGLAVAGGVFYATKAWFDYKDAVNEAAHANMKFMASTANINGINYSEYATKADKYLSIVHNKQLSINEAMGRHVELIKEQLGIMDQAKKEADKKPFSETHKELFDNASKPFGFGTTEEEKRFGAIKYYLTPDGKIDTALQVYQQASTSGSSLKSLLFNGINFGPESSKTYEQIAAARFLYSMGRNTAEGSELSEVIPKYESLYLQSRTVADFDAITGQLNNYIIDRANSVIEGSKYWSMDQIGANSFEENKRGYHYVTAFNKELGGYFDWQNPTTAGAMLMHTWREMLSSHETNKTISDALVQQFLLESGIDIFNKNRYGEFGEEVAKKWGWTGTGWGTAKVNLFNEKTGKWDREAELSGEQARIAFMDFHQRIVNTVNRLSPSIRPYFESFVNHPVWKLGSVDEVNTKEGSSVKYDGIDWVFQNGLWRPKNVFQKLLKSPMTEAEMNKALSLNGSDSGGGTGGSGGSGGGTGGNTGDYKSHYKSSSAAPKQLIVKIENLMNVESVDLSNPDNAATVNNLKSQLAQALIDVVHDFDNTFHG